MKILKEYIKILSDLTKFKITFFIAISSSVAYILYSGALSYDMILPIMGVFILSCGLSAFNQYQEIRTDGLMNRTRFRPLPSLRITPQLGFTIALTLTVVGLTLLYLTGNLIVFLLGIFAIIWYNLFYTPLKRKTAFAVIPGALVGTIPPAIGWVAAGGNLLDFNLWVFNLFIFIWQVPHFWLLMLIYEDDYKRAGFPVLTDIFNSKQSRRITYIWIIALVLSCILIPLFNDIHNPAILISLILAGFWLIWRTKELLDKFSKVPNYSFAFRIVNFYVLLTVILISIDRLI